MSDGALTFQQICRILDVTDRLGLDREWVEIPLSMERPGVVRRLPNGKLEIVADADSAFDEWLDALPARIRAVAPPVSASSASEA